MGGRHAVVVGSQCAGLPGQRLSFLPGRAESLFGVLTDPARGACDPGASRLLLDPRLVELAAVVKEAVAAAAAAGATLVLAFVGHAETLGDALGGTDLYLLPVDGVVPPDMDSGYLLGQRLREMLAGPNAVGLDGLLLILDACHAGVGLLNVAQAAAALAASSGVRLEMLAATFDRVARDGCFSEELASLLWQGLADESNDYIDAVAVLDRVANKCTQQEEPLRFAMARGRRIPGDPGLWLARNRKGVGQWALSGTAAGGQAVELTRSYQITDALERVQGAMMTSPLTVVVGGPGAGKSTLVAALARPNVAPGLVPAGGFLNAVVFTELALTAVEIAQELAVQLHATEGFAEAVERYRAGFEARDLDRQPALEQWVVGPLGMLDVKPGSRVRLAVDGLDRLPTEVRREVLQAVADLTGEGMPDVVRVLLTTRPGLEDIPVDGAREVPLGAPTAAETAAFTQHAGIPQRLVPALAEHAQSWLDLRLLAQLAADSGDAQLQEVENLDALYAARLRMETANNRGAGAALTVLAAAGSGPVLPIGLAAAAISALGEPVDVPGLRDVLAGMAGLVVRGNPGTDSEHVGLFHDTLTRYLLTHQPGQATIEAGHQVILDAFGAVDAVEDPAAAAYAQARRPEHLWALGRHGDALTAVLEGLGPRPGDNVSALRPWVDRARNALGYDHPSSLATRGNLAYWTGESGNVNGAVALFAEVLEDQLRVLGPDHPDTLGTRGNLAYWTAESGDLDGALVLIAEVLKDQVRVLGPEHPDTLTTGANAALWAGESGDVASALEMLRWLEGKARMLGPDHPTVFGIRSNLARWTGESGDVAGALTLTKALLQDRKRVLGPDHPTTLAARANLAFLTGESGDVPRAVGLYEAVLKDHIRVLGPDHPNTLAIRGNLARWIWRGGGVARALEMFEGLLEDEVRVLGQDHPNSFITRGNLANCTGESGDVLGAVTLIDRLLHDMTRVLGRDHPNTFIVWGSMAHWIGESGDVAGAVALFRELLEQQLRVLGPDHPNTFITRGNLADCTGKSGDVPGAVALWTQLLEDLVRVLGPDHEYTLAARGNLAHWSHAPRRDTGVERF